MSLIWMDGFDSQDLTRWTVGGGPALVAGRLGGYGVQLTNGGHTMTRNVPTSSTIAIGAAHKFTLINLNNMQMSLTSAENYDMVNIKGGSGGGWVLSYYSGFSTITNSLGAITVGNWDHFEILYTTHATTGRVQVKLNGNIVHNFTGDTSYAGNVRPIVRVGWVGAASSTYVVDDVWTSTGELYGDSRVRGLVPTADSTVAWTPSTAGTHWSLVDEIPPSMTDYVSATAGSGLSDKFTVTVPGDLTAVTAIQANAYGLKTDAGSAPLHFIADTQESTDIGFSTTAGGISAIFPTAAAGAAWTPAKLAAAGAVGIKAV